MSIANIMRNHNPIFDFFDSSVFSMGFKSLESFLKLNLRDVRMANNFTALFHASGASLLTGVYLLLGKNSDMLYWIQKFATGYFLYDVSYLIRNTKGLPKYLFMYHHLLSIYSIHKNAESYKTMEFYLAAELSNIPSYFVYYMLKTKNKNLDLMKKIQWALYAPIRVIVLGYYLKEAFNKNPNDTLPYFLLSVYLLGVIWTKKLWDKL